MSANNKLLSIVEDFYMAFPTSGMIARSVLSESRPV